MKITVSKIPDEGIEEEMDLLLSIEEDEPRGDVHVFLRANKYGKRVMLDGSAGMTVSLICSRCLKRFPHPLHVDFHEEYVPQIDIVDEEHELTEEEIDINYYRDDEIDVDNFIREQLILSLPIKPLCSVECRGICPICGKDLNEGPCGCRREEIDPRLLPLKGLRESLKRDRKE
ncbi:MAG: DUF177 domain-containing protein [Thermodesulfovibrionia bacterium]